MKPAGETCSVLSLVTQTQNDKTIEFLLSILRELQWRFVGIVLNDFENSTGPMTMDGLFGERLYAIVQHLFGYKPWSVIFDERFAENDTYTSVLKSASKNCRSEWRMMRIDYCMQSNRFEEIWNSYVEICE